MGRTGNHIKSDKPQSERQASRFLSYMESRIRNNKDMKLRSGALRKGGRGSGKRKGDKINEE
jgi:hypothetical protein